MTNLEKIPQKFTELKVCVIIPTYNNAATLAKVIEGIADYTTHIIVVNDGSSDNTESIAKSFPSVQLISYPDNVGKGWALRKAFRYATEKGYQFAITIDSDGQHFAKDLPTFIDKLDTVQDAIIIGSRNMAQDSVPGKSSFGHKFSNFWFKVETGIDCPDTQSGYRLYPLHLLKGMRFITRKYEFEIEVLVRAAWKGVKIDSVPVTVYYAPKETRISHFRPFKDFTRISILNTILVIITFAYIKPRNFFRSIFDKKKSKRILRDNLFNPDETDTIKALSVAFGFFMGVIPIWGFQLITAIFLSVLFRLNKALVIIAANISLPPMIPLIIFLSYKIGAFWVNDKINMQLSQKIGLQSINNNLQQYLYGSITLAIGGAIISGALTFVLLKLFKKNLLLPDKLHLMEKFFISIYKYFEKHRNIFFLCFGVVFLLTGWFATRVKFEEDISKVLPKDKKIEKLNEVFQNSKFIDKLVIIVSLQDTTAEHPDSLVAYADSFVNRVREKLPPYINKITDKVDDGLALELFNTITDKLPVYLNEKDYLAIDTLITPVKIKQTLEQDFRTLTSPAGIALKSMISNDPVGISFIGLKKLQQLQYDDNFELYDNYIVTKDYKHLMMFITPKYSPNNTEKNIVLLQGLDSIINNLKGAGFNNIDAAYFGATAVATGNALQLRKDALFTQGITIVFLVVFLGFYFRKKRAPFIILVPVVFGALFSLAAIYFIKGSISVIAIGTGSVILGIAVNYSLHVFNHYRHTRSVEEVIKDLSFPLTIGSFTTIGGFFCLEFVESEMLKDLGLFAAFSLIGAALCSLIFLPHFISSKKEQATHKAAPSWIDKIASYNPEYNKFLVIIIIAGTFVFAYTARHVGFESDMLKMNYMSDKLHTVETKLNTINQYAAQSVYLVVEGKTLDEALVNNEKLVADIEKLKEKNIVKKYSGVSSLIISGSLQKKRIERWKDYWTAEKKRQLFATLEKEGSAIGFKPAAFDKFKMLLNKDFVPAGNEETEGFRKNFLDDFITEKPGKATVVTLVKVAAADKQVVYNAFENNPNITVVDKQYLAGKFVEIINADFTSIAIMTSLLVFIVLLMTYGRIELTMVSFIPMFITWIWILGLMGIFGIQFNIVNIIISALIFGLGDDYSLFIMDGLLQEYKTGKKNLSSYKSSIFLSAITTIAGLGVLIFAKHPALRSIALISIIGILCVVVMSQILIPFFFNILIRDRVQKNKYPWTLRGYLISAFAFSYFILGCIILTILGLLFKLNPFNKEKGKLIYHFILARFCWSLMYIMMNFKKEIINPQKENFSKPAVIICNHQSFLDILSVVMLHPKLILFTNDWVWNSPFFGAVVRMADYYPVAQGAESSIELLKDKVKLGYSILVFPEGTRTLDGTMKRFHKGPFYLAEQLNLDILPIVIHGTGYTMTKGDFLLKDGKVTLKFLPRIKPTDTQFGNTYAERTKLIGRYFKDAFRQLRQDIEQPDYFREQLVYNYIYKGPVLEWYMKIKIRLEKNYKLIHELLPAEGKMLDIGCGYGFMSYMLHFTSPKREITGIDYDEEKIATASHCFSKDERINFACADILAYPFEQYDAIIMSDILHYLQPEEQKLVIEKCISHLNPGGTILIRDGNKDLEERHKGTRLTEFFSTKFLAFNKITAKGLSFLSGSLIKEIALAHNMQCKEIDQTKYTSNIIFVIK